MPLQFVQDLSIIRKILHHHFGKILLVKGDAFSLQDTFRSLVERQNARRFFFFVHRKIDDGTSTLDRIDDSIGVVRRQNKTTISCQYSI